MKQTLLNNEYQLCSKKPDMVKQELWVVLLGYNLLRYQMLSMAKSIKGLEPNQLSFTVTH